jgi:hypothetical protein
MKKIMIITILCFTSLVSFAQISRTFWGCTLGKSNKNNVRTVLINRGYRVNTESDGSYTVKSNNIYFGGVNWSYVSFSFVNGILYDVWFQNNEYESAISPDRVYEKLKLELDEKYGRYYFYLGTDDGNTNWSNYSDGKTSILLSVRYYNYTKYVSVSYFDEYLRQVKKQKENDEL